MPNNDMQERNTEELPMRNLLYFNRSYLRGVDESHDNNPTIARSYFNSALTSAGSADLHPSALEIHYQIGKTYLAEKKLDEALECFDYLHYKIDDNSLHGLKHDVESALAIISVQLSRATSYYQEAMQHLDKLNVDKEEISYDNEKIILSAKFAIDRAMEINPHEKSIVELSKQIDQQFQPLRDALLQKADTAYDSGDYKQAAEHYRKLLRIYPDSRSFQTRLEEVQTILTQQEQKRQQRQKHDALQRMTMRERLFPGFVEPQNSPKFSQRAIPEP